MTVLVVTTSAAPAAAGPIAAPAGDAPVVLPSPDRISFVDVSLEAGVAGEYRTWGSVWGDYDDDGDPDLMINRHHGDPLLMRNDGGTYARVAEDDLVGEYVDRHGCVWGEANQDGRVDLYCAQGADRGKGSGPNQLLVQTDAGFDEVAAELGVADPFGRGRTVNWLDHDDDGDLDLYVGNTTREDHPNAFFARLTRGFVDADRGLARSLSTVGASWADWDNDGDADLLVNQHRGAATLAFEDRGMSFRTTRLPGVTGRGWMSTTWGDFDQDGWTDLVAVERDRLVVFRNARGDLRRVFRRPLKEGRMAVWLDVENDADLDLFVVQGARGTHESPDEINHPDLLVVRDAGFRTVRDLSFRGPLSGNGDAVAAADHDRDGRMDLFVTNGLFHWDGPVQLLQNDTPAGNWVGVDLEGDVSNPWGYGARVVVSTPRGVYRRLVTDGFSFRTQSETGYLHFGLGRADSATVRVVWPDGTRSCAPAATATVVEVAQQPSRCS